MNFLHLSENGAYLKNYLRYCLFKGGKPVFICLQSRPRKFIPMGKLRSGFGRYTSTVIKYHCLTSKRINAEKIIYLPFTASFNTLPDLNLGAFDAGISIGSLV